MRPLLVTVGDPQGVGPEVACKAAAQRPDLPLILVGAPDVLSREVARYCPGAEFRAPPAGPDPVEVRAIRYAAEEALAVRASAVVTGPIHKARLAARGFAHPGHTEFLAEICGVTDPVMAFEASDLRVALVTVHLPLSAVPEALSTARVLHTIRTFHRAMRRQLGLKSPRVLVCGLNPHAGDDGLLGHEDASVVAPAVGMAKEEGIMAVGPVSAEAAFTQARRGEGDGIVAMYHDQGLAPLKAVAFGRSVNWTLGLPIVRTSVDHGTADDLAGKGLADPGSMIAAIDLAARLSAR